MTHPREILSRARRRRTDTQPVPQPPSPAPAPTAPTAVTAPTEPVRPAPQPAAGGHALYRQLMRSHDRMGTRHLPRNG